jgi:hypothetical protein
MKVKMILPALTEAKSPYWRSIKYSLFPPLGLATLAGYLNDQDEIQLQDEHVETLDLDDEPDLVLHPPTGLLSWQTITGGKARTSAWADCTSPLCPMKPCPTPIQFSSVQAKIPGPHF